MSTPTEIQSETVQSRKKWYRSPWMIGLIVVVLAGLAYGGIRMVAHAQYSKGMAAYFRMDSPAAADAFSTASKFPAIFGGFTEDAARRLEEVQTFQQASADREAGRYAEAVEQYQQIVNTYETSVYVLESQKQVSSVPFEWLQTAQQAEDYPSAVEALQLVIEGDFSELEKQEASRQLPAVYQSWGEHQLTAKEYQGAVESFLEAYSLSSSQAFRSQTEGKINQAYAGWIDELAAAGDYPQALEVCEAQTAWLEEYELHGVDAVNTRQAELLLAWGDALAADNNYEEAITQYQQALALGVPAVADGVAQGITEAYLAFGAQQLAEGLEEESAETFAALIITYPEMADAAARIPEEALPALMDYALSLSEQEEFEQAAAVFGVAEQIAAEGGSDEVYAQALYGHAQALYDWNNQNLLAVLVKANDGLALTADEALLADLETVRAAAAEEASSSEDALGKLILAAYRQQVEKGIRNFPYCTKISGEEMCLTEAEFLAAADTLGLDEEDKRFILIEGELDKDLQAKTPGQAYYGISLRYITSEVERCKFYFSGAGGASADLVRYRRITMVTLFDLETGEVITQENFNGSDPDKCPSKWYFSSLEDKIYGDSPDDLTILIWLQKYTD